LKTGSLRTFSAESSPHGEAAGRKWKVRRDTHKERETEGGRDRWSETDGWRGEAEEEQAGTEWVCRE